MGAFSRSLLPFSKATLGTRDVGEVDYVAGRSVTAYGVSLGIRTNRPNELGSLSEYLPPLWRPSSRSRVDRLFSFSLGESRHALFEERDQVGNETRLERLLLAFETRAKMYVAEVSPRYVFVHAGVVGWRDKAIVVPGRTFAGKTTLVAAMVRAGATYYSDEYAVFDEKGRVRPYPRPLGMRVRGSAEQTKCSVESLGGVVGKAPLTVGLVVAAEYDPSARWAPRALGHGEALLELLNNTVSARRKPAVVLATLNQALREAIGLKGPRGEADETAELILMR